MYVTVDFICFGWFELFCHKKKARIIKWKILAHSGFWTWYVSLRTLVPRCLHVKDLHMQCTTCILNVTTGYIKCFWFVWHAISLRIFIYFINGRYWILPPWTEFLMYFQSNSQCCLFLVVFTYLGKNSFAWENTLWCHRLNNDVTSWWT